ncbi:MAG TPA: hemolysin family protein [Thermoanaerobaculia bacterium]|jgi:CBS domain containing-hemolysin-like protein|nr:hemolysin family protein [Thermoanaerobaculia bacterium]
MDPQIPLYVAAFVLSLVFSAFFAGSETALVSLGRIDLQAMREKGDRRGALIRSLRSNTPRLLAVILIGQNLFLSAASASATTLAERWFPKYGVLAAVVFSTLTLFVFAEMMPKAIASASPVPVARAAVVPLSWIMRILAPIAELCVRLTRGALRVLGIREAQPGLTEEELKSVINLGADEGVIHREERRLLHNVVEFGDKTVRDVMIPRTKIVAVPETASFEDVKMVLREHKFSRLPVYRGTLDNVVGILHAKDLFDLSDADEQRFRMEDYLDAPFLVPEFKRAEDLLGEMRRRKTHISIVVDEHGGTAGLVTLENAIEALLGQIQDEYDEEKPGFEAAGEHTFLLDGSLRLDDFENQFGIALPRDEAETIAGHLMLRFGRIPRKGERWKGRFADFVIEDAAPTAIRKVRMILPEKKKESRETQ